MNNTIVLSIVIVSFNTKDILRRCLTILEKEYVNLTCETIVIDNASKDSSAQMVETEFPNVKLIKSPINLGFGAANNVGFRLSKGKYIVILNSDAFLQSNALSIAVKAMENHPKCGLAGGRLLNEDGSWQPSIHSFPTVLDNFLILSGLADKYPNSRFFGRFHHTWSSCDEPKQVDWITGAFSIIRRDVLETIKYFDERFFLYYEEVDLCRRIKQIGYEIWYFPNIKVIHLGGESAKTMNQILLSGSQLLLWYLRSMFLYFRKHEGYLGALFAKHVDINWHRLRILKNILFHQPESKMHIEESKKIIATTKQAWKDTLHGKISPPKPW